MRQAMDETNRRREKQIAHNEAHGITPQALKKRITDVMDTGEEVQNKAAQARLKPASKKAGTTMDASEIAKEISRLEAQMHEFARDLEFEKAAKVRDQVHELQQQLIHS